ncbi:MAG: PAS domain-containing protein [Alphaproteobacteria bacterium]|nr:PAS domain-containing protein [Alphaproteobacteria bacterium]
MLSSVCSMSAAVLFLGGASILAERPIAWRHIVGLVVVGCLLAPLAALLLGPAPMALTAGVFSSACWFGSGWLVWTRRARRPGTLSVVSVCFIAAGMVAIGMALRVVPVAVAAAVGPMMLWLILLATVRATEQMLTVELHQARELVDRTRAAERVSAEHLGAIMEHAPIGIFLKDATRRYLSINPQCAAWMGDPVAAFIGKRDEDLSAERAARQRPSDEAVLLRGEVVRVVRAPGEIRPGLEQIEVIKFPLRDAAGTVVGLCGFTFNVTERVRLEKQLAQAAKTEALCRLAGGIAHDFNNVIGAIQGYAAFLQEDLADRPEERGFAQRILTACTSAKDLVGNLLRFARSARSEPMLMDVRAGIESARILVKPLVGSRVTVSWQLPPEPVWVQADSIQLQQVVLNLCVNARDAIGDRDGRIDVVCEAVPGDGGDRALFLGERSDARAVAVIGALVPGGDYVAIRVRDSGSGMDQRLLDQIFEPLFTTKTEGQGTGLGLGVVQGAALSAKGALSVISAPGVGTVFSVYWPVSRAPTGTKIVPGAVTAAE